MGNPTTRTPEKDAAVLADIRVRGNVTKACATAKVARGSWYQWLEDDPELKAAHDAAMAIGRDNRADRAEDKLWELVERGDVTATIFTLKTLRRDIYGDRQMLEHTGKDGAPLTVVIAERSDGPA